RHSGSPSGFCSHRPGLGGMWSLRRFLRAQAPGLGQRRRISSGSGSWWKSVRHEGRTLFALPAGHCSQQWYPARGTSGMDKRKCAQKILNYLANMSESRTEVSSLGEFGLIDHLTKNIEVHNASSIVGVGDDAAVIDHFGKQTVITNDLLIEGVHFDLMYTPLKHLGYKTVVVNVSDICAMNAQPTQVILGLAFSNRFSVEALDEFYEGVYAACAEY